VPGATDPDAIDVQWRAADAETGEVLETEGAPEEPPEWAPDDPGRPF
jgi:hypothetical protein